LVGVLEEGMHISSIGATRTLPFGLPQHPTLDPLELDPIDEGDLGMFISNDPRSNHDGLEI